MLTTHEAARLLLKSLVSNLSPTERQLLRNYEAQEPDNQSFIENLEEKWYAQLDLPLPTFLDALPEKEDIWEDFKQFKAQKEKQKYQIENKERFVEPIEDAPRPKKSWNFQSFRFVVAALVLALFVGFGVLHLQPKTTFFENKHPKVQHFQTADFAFSLAPQSSLEEGLKGEYFLKGTIQNFYFTGKKTTLILFCGDIKLYLDQAAGDFSYLPQKNRLILTLKKGQIRVEDRRKPKEAQILKAPKQWEQDF
ncbi:hypothetical protein [Hugenholtzia roseola]|uniref:hypothetical protein n=1 Tax=Hugenholtzia roseola TaxID=1002 RepID=UPI0003FEA19A|nr:hypothetical protein [Hugenholtzia roseola]